MPQEEALKPWRMEIWETYPRAFTLPLGQLRDVCSALAPSAPVAPIPRGPVVTCQISHSSSMSFPSLSCFSASLLVLPRISSQIKYLYSNPFFRSHSGEHKRRAHTDRH